jgi:lactoylglutathione lyase
MAAMELGAFSVSLAVKDIAASRRFYEQLGFSSFGGEQAKNWLIMKNGDHVIGLFQGMFDRNILTFNPGWDQAARTLPALTLMTEADESTTGPASFMLTDPDGNMILVDQHV